MLRAGKACAEFAGIESGLQGVTLGVTDVLCCVGLVYEQAAGCEQTGKRGELIAQQAPEDDDEVEALAVAHRGLIHEVVLEQYLKFHANLRAVEFYLCGPPQMISACRKMLGSLGVADHQIAFDEF